MWGETHAAISPPSGLSSSFLLDARGEAEEENTSDDDDEEKKLGKRRLNDFKIGHTVESSPLAAAREIKFSVAGVVVVVVVGRPPRFRLWWWWFVCFSSSSSCASTWWSFPRFHFVSLVFHHR